MVTPGQIRLVRAEGEDAEILANLSRRAFQSDMDVGAPGEGGPPGYDSVEFQVRMIEICQYYKMIFEGRIVGGLFVSGRRPGHYELERIFVDPDYQNRGIATEAFEQVFATYRDAKIWTLDTPEWNARTKHFYEKLGFVQIGWIKAYPTWRGRYYEKPMDTDQRYERLRISDLTPGMKRVETEAKILEVSEPRQVRSETGEPLSLAEAIIGDETGTMKLVLWNDQIRQVQVNDKIRINQGYVTSFRGQKQLSTYCSPVILI